MVDVDSEKGGCTSAFGIREENDVQKQRKSDAERTGEE